MRRIAILYVASLAICSAISTVSYSAIEKSVISELIDNGYTVILVTDVKASPEMPMPVKIMAFDPLVPAPIALPSMRIAFPELTAKSVLKESAWQFRTWKVKPPA